MYLAVAAVIAGQALVLGRWVLVGYGSVFGLAVWSFVHWYEEPTLRRQLARHTTTTARPFRAGGRTAGVADRPIGCELTTPLTVAPLWFRRLFAPQAKTRGNSPPRRAEQSRCSR
jgi:hypothetical protein